jgi:hypothetical protein
VHSAGWGATAASLLPAIMRWRPLSTKSRIPLLVMSPPKPVFVVVFRRGVRGGGGGGGRRGVGSMPTGQSGAVYEDKDGLGSMGGT